MLAMSKKDLGQLLESTRQIRRVKSYQMAKVLVVVED